MVRAKITTDLNLMSLIGAVSAESGLSTADTQKAVQTTLDVVGRALAAGHKVKITNFGTFEPARRRVAKGALGGRVERSRMVRVVRFHLNGRLLEAVRSGRRVTTLKKTGKSAPAA